MIETYYAGTYGAARRESAEECARRTQVFLQMMARCDPLFARWFIPRRSRKQAPTPITPEIAALRDMLALDRVFNDEKNVIEDLGFNLSLDNGTLPGLHRESHVHLRIRCGVYAEHVGNACVLNLPSSGPDMGRILSAPMLANIMRAMILAWDPGWGIAASHAHLDLLSEPAIVGTFVGWIMYFPRQLGSVPPLPSPVQVEPVEDKGSLVILTPERFTASNPEHVSLAARVHDMLSHAGLLKPLS
jgi:Immunity protein 52